MSKIINVPKLRFKEFSGEWEEKYLSELGTFKNGLNKSKEDFGFGYPFVNLMDVFGKDVVFSEKFDLVNANEKDLKLYNLLKGDILFIRSSVKREGVGETILVLDDLENTTYSGFLIRFREKTKYLNLLFKKYCFKTKKFRKSLLSLSTTSANTNINQESLNLLKLNFPAKQEQEKIASFLTSVDIKIEQLTKKEELLQQYKKGVMQKIFNQEIRFKDDDVSEFCDWDEKKLGDVCNIKKGSQLNKDTLTYIGDYPALNGGINPSGYTTDWNTEANTITISEGGNSCGYVNFVTTRFWSGGHNYSLQELENTINPKYLYQYLKFNELNIMKLRVGSGLPNIQKSAISSFNINILCIEEQTKIANFLSSIDSKIEQVQKQLNFTKEFKKALLQQMFV